MSSWKGKLGSKKPTKLTDYRKIIQESTGPAIRDIIPCYLSSLRLKLHFLAVLPPLGVTDSVNLDLVIHSPLADS